MEKWNAYTRDGQLTDEILIRGEVIPEGLYFIACGVLVRHVDGSFLCMKRAKVKSSFGGYLEATAHGAAQLGDSVLLIVTKILFVCKRVRQKVMCG